ncbi:hypothetical protein VTI28DRAFT_8747 [Corynascus sepedonium]
MRIFDPHQFTVTGFANLTPGASTAIPPPYSEHLTDEQRAPTRDDYLRMGLELPPPRYAPTATAVTTSNNSDNNNTGSNLRSSHRPRHPAPKYPPQPFQLPGDECADAVLRSMTLQAEDALDSLEREANAAIAGFCALKRWEAASTTVGAVMRSPDRGDHPEWQEEAEEDQVQQQRRPVRGVLLGRVEFEKGVAKFVEAFKEGKRQVYDRLVHLYGRYKTDMVWDALEASKLLPSEYSKVLAQNPANSDVICLWDSDEEENEEEEELDECNQDAELRNREVRGDHFQNNAIMARDQRAATSSLRL